MDEDLERYLSLVRVFPDCAETVIWFAPGPVPYDIACVSNELRDAMNAWETAWEREISDERTFPSPEIAHELATEGRRVAEWLSAELGDSFDVELRVSDTRYGHQLIRGTGAGSNPRAVAAFREMARAHRARHDELEGLRSQGVEFGWFAHPPGSSSRADGT
ncbi:MAG: hypothetical protein EPN91_09450 [Salinibacterium sp.]|nr:MAG: hypothetical protein EPN91_09450 [Salinibacterium sp.]